MRKLLIALLICFAYAHDMGEEFAGKENEIDLDKLAEYININENDMVYRLYTRRNSQTGVVLKPGDKTNLLASGFKGTSKTKICTHGFQSNGQIPWLVKMKDELLKAEDINVILLDWSICTKTLLYNEAAACTKKAGPLLGEFLKFLQKEAKVDLSKVHLIGHSLGAHMVSFASRAIPTAQAVGRVTGLDPAGPLFENAAVSERINPKCAKLVDAIHTCRVTTGMKKPVGTYDFYPNGGFNQPGCSTVNLLCNHQSSYLYFTDSIDKAQKSKYLSKKCKTLDHAIGGNCTGPQAAMGYYSDSYPGGIYHLKITSIPKKYMIQNNLKPR